MVATRDKHRQIVAEHLDAGEDLQALVHVNTGGPGGASSAQPGDKNVSRYHREHDIVEKGLNGNYDLADIWLALTDRRLLVFTGSWFTFTPKPKKLLTDVPRDSFSMTWRDEKAASSQRRLYHFRFADEQHVVRMGEVDDEAGRFVAALADQAAPMPDDG